MPEALMISQTETAEQNQAPAAAEALTPQAVRAQLERILNSKAFARSPRISRFLSFVVEQTLDGQESKLKEYLLGVEVFGRMDSFDPRIDSIVRVEARRLRYKLEKYYETEGQNDTVHIQFRKGCYVPAFAEKRPGETEPGNAELSDVPNVIAIGNPHAFALYARARYSLGRWTADGIAEAVSCFTHAIEEDPECASAHAGLSSAWMFAAMLGLMPSRDVVPKAKASAQRALGISATCAEAYSILGMAAALEDGEWEVAESKLRKAIHVNPSDPNSRVWYGLYLTMLGRTEDAVRELRRAQQAAPTSLTTHLALGFACHAAKAYDEALMQYRLVQDIDSSFYGSYLAMGLLFTDQQMYEQATQMLSRAAQLSARNPGLMAVSAYAHGAAERNEAAQQAAGELAQIAERQYVPPIWLAMAHAAAGDLNAACAKLEEAREERSVWLPVVNFLPAFSRLRQDERFNRFVA
jgi:tetratricopeptide (TPR) repeat protein